MGKKYSLNGAGRIIAERDIYSLGGIILKGTPGGYVKDETQLSQEGECWLNAGDISNRPDIVIKDNAFIGEFYPGENPVHTDGITEFSGNTKIPGKISVRSFAADTKNNVFIRDSFIGVSMSVLCGPATKATNFPMEQGRYNQDAPKGTLFTSSTMKLDAENFVRNTATLRIGKDTYVYTPQGFNARIYWAYYDYANNGLAYAGETEVCNTNIYKLSHPVYNVCMIAFAKNPTLTPEELETAGAKILGHVSASVLTDIRPESVSGEYAIINSSLIAETNNFGLSTTQLRFLAGGLYNTNMYTLTNRQDYKPYGTFRNVERLEFTQYFADIHRGNVNRDHYIVASDSPLVRINDSFVSGSLVNAGGVTLRRCIVPKGVFQDDIINGNTYEDIDFSYTYEFMGNTVGIRTFVSSHKQGLYSLYASSGVLTGLVSYPDNIKDATSITERHSNIPLDGDIIESGTYEIIEGQNYVDCKIGAGDRVRFSKPVSTTGLNIPSLPSGYKVRYAYYLDEYFSMVEGVEEPTSIKTTHPFVLLAFRKEDTTALISPSEFIALNVSLFVSDYTKVPEITGSAYVGAGCTVRGDVQLQGDPYVNRIFDINMWERGTTQDGDLPNYPTWSDRKIPTGAGNRFRFVDAFEVEPGGTFTCANSYLIHLYRFDGSGKWIGQAGWATSQYIPEGTTRFAGLIIKKASSASDAGGLITEEDIALAGVKYLRAFKRRRYITNEQDRKNADDILLEPDYWEQGSMSSGEANAGKTYEELKTTYTKAIRLKRPINVFMPGQSTSQGAGFNVSRQLFDAATKLYAPVTDAVSYKTALITLVTVKSDASDVLPSDAPNSRVYIEFAPSPRIIVPYGSNTLSINGVKIRMYDNAVLSRNFNQEGSITLQGDAVMGYDFDSGACLCSNGHDDAIIKLP